MAKKLVVGITQGDGNGIGINLADARIPDNAGEQPADEPLQADGPTAYFATIPVNAMVQNVREHGLPCHVSFTAGTYVCNCVMYNVLHLCVCRHHNVLLRCLDIFLKSVINSVCNGSNAS